MIILTKTKELFFQALTLDLTQGIFIALFSILRIRANQDDEVEEIFIEVPECKSLFSFLCWNDENYGGLNIFIEILFFKFQICGFRD